uniref:PX domain-containing protein EREX-like n=1 Tax=Erigeron canadensis TaxID=72917 RepID=UPI001CB94E25|nr:PX domain-containing protein EREX-like [Erigeron canadensis]
MSMYGYDVSIYDYGFSNQAISNSLRGHTINYDDDELYFRRPPPLRHSPPVTPPTNHRHDGTSPLPLGMDWSLPPRVWEGRNSVWPHDSNKGWRYCVTVPSWTIASSTSGSDAVFFRVQVGVQSPEGITSTQEVLRRFNEFWKLYSDLRTEFPKKYLPLPPPKSLMKMRSNTLLEERRCALEGWLEKLLSDIDVSRTALVAMFLELEAAARKSCSELTPDDRVTNLVPSDQLPCNSANSLLSSSSSISSDIDGSSGSKKATTVEQNEILQKELDNAKEQIETLRKSKSDVKLLVKEVKSLRKSNLELKHELTKCLEEKTQLENEKQQWEAGDSTKVALLHECEHLCNRLRECSVNFILDEEDKLMADTSLSDAIDLLETSDSQISSLLAEVQFLGQDDETATGPANQADNSDIFISRDGDLRTLLSDILTENAMLRKQVNSVIRQALTKPGDTPKDEAGDDPIM